MPRAVPGEGRSATGPRPPLPRSGTLGDRGVGLSAPEEALDDRQDAFHPAPGLRDAGMEPVRRHERPVRGGLKRDIERVHVCDPAVTRQTLHGRVAGDDPVVLLARVAAGAPPVRVDAVHDDAAGPTAGRGTRR